MLKWLQTSKGKFGIWQRHYRVADRLGAESRRGGRASGPAFTSGSEDKFPAQFLRSLSTETAFSSTMPMILGYWDIRGLAHAIRLLLEYTGSDYEEKRYTMGDAPDYDRSHWLNEKFKLGLDFPNLPYLIDGAHRLTQSNAIVRYIARKHNMCGETEEEKIRVDVFENQAMDVRFQMVRLCYSPDFEKLKSDFLEEIPGIMKLFSEFLGKRTWFAGDKLTFVDFLAYDVLDVYRIFEPKCLDEFPNLKDFMSCFEGLKKISAYMKSSRFLPNPPFSKMAMWGNK
ncbi:Glutathione S-transferase Mu 1 [Camelus dromedarius]|uniref:Glutathione S-transferase n=2 Tax=Camelus dromedarius TaxID=9838 RepID=A0A5N4DUU8_CAMDR|nr:Glutathione S-transferase Mu 1 [Camelus dromedarius]